jgi:flagellin-like protein
MPNKGLGKRKAVSPVIATLILIAITVAVAIIAYSWITGIVGGFGGAPVQVQEVLSLDGYNYAPVSSGCTMYIRNAGATQVQIAKVYFDGTQLTWGSTSFSGSPNPGYWYVTSASTTIDVGNSLTLIFRPSSDPSPGTSHIVTIVTQSGARFVFTVIAGRTG